MLLNLNKKSWIDGLRLQDYNEHCKLNENTVKTMLDLADGYNKALEEEEKMTPEQLAIKNVGKQVSERMKKNDWKFIRNLKNILLMNKTKRTQNVTWKRT